ncbi:uncharacterized protein LOC120557117 [Perca fluviatilis]|uniref:uncharacterized protein LOC120557117 n=1 Tax=Perca fluviatilis TaxID=8168 RepID=UPI0019635807|nr:uncharacterized protein LOC120557117 [Perca fluviatilis]
MELLLLLCLCLLTRSGVTSAQLNGPPLIVVEGSDVMLPCTLSTKENIESKLFDWRKAAQKDEGLKEVFLYDGGIHFNNGLDGQSEEFKGRVSHFQDELKHGNSSIIIRNTTISDSGVYICYFPHLQPPQIFYIDLVVGDGAEPTSGPSVFPGPPGLSVPLDIASPGLSFAAGLQRDIAFAAGRQRGISFTDGLQRGLSFAAGLQRGLSFAAGLQRAIAFAAGRQRGISFADGLQRGLSFAAGLLRDIAFADGLLRDIAFTDGLQRGLSFTVGLLRDIAFADGLLRDIAFADGRQRGIAFTAGRQRGIAFDGGRLRDFPVLFVLLRGFAVADGLLRTLTVLFGRLRGSAFVAGRLKHPAFVAGRLWDSAFSVFPRAPGTLCSLCSWTPCSPCPRTLFSLWPLSVSLAPSVSSAFLAPPGLIWFDFLGRPSSGPPPPSLVCLLLLSCFVFFGHLGSVPWGGEDSQLGTVAEVHRKQRQEFGTDPEEDPL